MHPVDGFGVRPGGGEETHSPRSAVYLVAVGSGIVKPESQFNLVSMRKGLINAIQPGQTRGHMFVCVGLL
ncbi:MAG: hypothetical protein KBG20_06775 [Caldilineaceae bacterium]|nr:hypothetical protein [Caldilineaceae bacterium]MBP8106489.1 hypothetical protein [Caldilineaceae bacterium]MBP8121253.1 hypothetical protein [Caldilineaceae bacterium]MBP9071982.1 hypothetical protein [Caldilineaceae bacterium]